ncbi:uncharacterized protein SOCE26_095980 [Sorangium cellulosum]|uniref:Uncharacterized protein n=1 Tax=Sorangium cellulosum TaxID=56 RepID=A0A2L0F979_SORCE|nr:uncharacterized protein SOCE26_095980 [Sorangium cellulosum]
MRDIMQLRAVWPFWSPRGRFRGWEATPVSGESGAAARPHVRTGGGVLQEAAAVQSSSLALLRGRPAPERVLGASKPSPSSLALLRGRPAPERVLGGRPALPSSLSEAPSPRRPPFARSRGDARGWRRASPRPTVRWTNTAATRTAGGWALGVFVNQLVGEHSRRVAACAPAQHNRVDPSSSGGGCGLGRAAGPAEPYRAIRSWSRGCPPMVPRRAVLAAGAGASATSCGSMRVSASASSSLIAQATARRRARGRLGRAINAVRRPARGRHSARSPLPAHGAALGRACSRHRAAREVWPLARLSRRHGQVAGASRPTSAGAGRQRRWCTLWTVRPQASVVFSFIPFDADGVIRRMARVATLLACFGRRKKRR